MQILPVLLADVKNFDQPPASRHLANAKRKPPVSYGFRFVIVKCQLATDTVWRDVGHSAGSGKQKGMQWI